MSGVFNLRYACSLDQQKKIVQSSLRHLFAHARRAISVDFMTDDVDYQGATPTTRMSKQFKFAPQN